jgi:glycosyltransferase involved in cell wall biosynthesis
LIEKKPLIIACIPAYNEEKTIAKVIIKTQKYVDKVIVCDDGSKDMTSEIAERLGAI